MPVLAVSGAAAAPGSASAQGATASPAAGPGGPIALSTLNVADAERVLIQHALQAADNNRTKAAELLGISVRTLRNKLNGPGKDSDDE
jgi:DNA-binding NtrC family response regulator